MSKWVSVGVVDNENMMAPHILQQKAEWDSSTHTYERVDEHRLVPVTSLDGVE